MKYLSCILVAVFAACGSNTLSPEEQLTKLKSDAWEFFEYRNYGEAESAFREAVQIDASDSESQLGLGWSFLYQRSLSAAASTLARIGRSDTSFYSHAQAGIAVVYDAQGQYDRAVVAAVEALTSDTAYVFLYDRRVDWRDLTYLLAKDYFAASAQIDPTLNQTLRYLARIDAGTPIEPADAETWTADGSLFATPHEAVLRRLETLYTLFAAL